MARIARVFGIILIVLGAVYFFMTGAVHPTSLIPAYFGIVLVICGVLANTEDAKKRMLWMHIAVTIGLLGFVFPGVMAAIELAKKRAGFSPAVQDQIFMSVVCLVFTAMCVRSFIAARVGRRAEMV